MYSILKLNEIDFLKIILQDPRSLFLGLVFAFTGNCHGTRIRVRTVNHFWNPYRSYHIHLGKSSLPGSKVTRAIDETQLGAPEKTVEGNSFSCGIGEGILNFIRQKESVPYNIFAKSYQSQGYT